MHNGKNLASTGSIAELTGISEGYLEQLFIPLRKAGIIRANRGRQGGYTPGRAPEHITVGDILRTVEGDLEPVDCIKSKPCPVSHTCASRKVWVDLYREINDTVNSITLADLANSAGKMPGKTMEQAENP